METAENSTVVPLSVDAAHRHWQTWTGERATSAGGTGPTVAEEVGGEQLPTQIPQPDSGMIYFHEVDPGSTRVTMQLRYSARAVEEAGLSPDYVSKRIGMYLQRFRDAASGRGGP